MEDVSTLESNEGASPRSLFVSFNVRDGVIFAHLVGPSIGQREAPIITAAVAAECEKLSSPLRAIVLDFKDVSFMNSTGLSMCIQVRSEAEKRGGAAILYRTSETIASVLKMTKIDRLFTLASDAKRLEKALR